jgi:hypothetical protein
MLASKKTKLVQAYSTRFTERAVLQKELRSQSVFARLLVCVVILIVSMTVFVFVSDMVATAPVNCHVSVDVVLVRCKAHRFSAHSTPNAKARLPRPPACE